MTDDQLLAEFVERQSQDAFAQLVSRYAPLVYAGTRRQVPAAQADDVTQAVFILLADKARQLRGRGTLAGWLLKATHFVAREALRRERRLKRREQVAALAMSQTRNTDDPALWDELRPVIDRALLRLKPGDRDVVVLRFFQSKSLRDVGSAVGISEEAARKRVDRAMQRLRDFLLREGVRAEPAALASALAVHGLESPPASLLAGKATAGSISLSKGAILLMGAKTKIAIGVALGVLLLAGTGGAVYRYYSGGNPSVVVVHPAHTVKRTSPIPVSVAWAGEKQGHFVVAHALDRQGRLWIGTEDDGLWLSEAGKWKPIRTPGDDGVYSLAVDLQGRVWVGHCRSGVSVYNGQDWRNYNALSGPLGQHVVAIAVCPATALSGAGDVWLATELGLSRYSVATDSWSYVTRADGLPSDQASCIAFNAAGDLYVGTQCDGLAIARAAEGYRTWKTIRGPAEPPAQSHGIGLPSSSINAILVTRKGTVLVGTNHGLARLDPGADWTFMRGRDWIAKVKESIDGPPPSWKPDSDAILAEDFVFSLAEDAEGRLWIGYRIKGCQCLAPEGNRVLFADNPASAQYCRWIQALPGRSPLIGSYGNGVVELKGPRDVWASLASADPAVSVAFPSPAAPPEEAELKRLAAKVNSSPNPTEVAAFLGQDWTTRGDWVGRYGRQRFEFPISEGQGSDQYVSKRLRAGPRGDPLSGFRYWDGAKPENPNMPFLPGGRRRVMFEWNDGGWQSAFNADFEGPDLWLDVQVPAGLSRITLYHFIPGKFDSRNRRRDFTAELLKYDPDLNAAQRAPVLADTRIVPDQAGSYRTFLVSEGHYWVHIKSDYSYGATLQAVYLDRADVTAPAPYDTVPACLNGTHFDPPQPPPALATDPSRLRAARALWSALDEHRAGSVNMQLPYRTLAHRAALADHAAPELLANWRWELHLWTDEDQKEWEQVTAKAKKPMQEPAVSPVSVSG